MSFLDAEEAPTHTGGSLNDEMVTMVLHVLPASRARRRSRSALTPAAAQS